MRSLEPVSHLGALLLAGLPLISCVGDPIGDLIEHRELLDGFDWWDNRDWSWYEENIPFIETPDPELDATYYYRWELLTKHLVYGSPETGYTLTEFIHRPFWSGAYGAISCPLGHQAYELRWLKNRRIIEDFARYWFETPGAEPRSYSNWYGDAMWATYEVLGDRGLLEVVFPHMEAQVAGWTEERWDPEHEMYRWVGAWDGMETNINSRLTDDQFGGAEGYRPTLNSYLFADMLAVSEAARLFGKEERGAEYRARALALKARVQEELWDAERSFFFHQFASDEKDGIQAKSLTYETGPFAGNPHGRELLGYVPWQFGLPDSGYEEAWSFLMDPDYFWAPFGPTGVEQGDPQFLVSPRCCVWSGNAWPYATSQTLTAMANLLNDYDQDVVDRTDYFTLLTTYVRSHRQGGRPYLAEASDPFTGSFSGHNTFYHSEHYLHSGFIDQVISGLIGIRPRADDTLQVNPLVPEDWGYFALEGVEYHGHDLRIFWDRDGSRYSQGQGLAVFLNGIEIARRPELGEIRIAVPPPVVSASAPRLNNYAVNNHGEHFPHASASASHSLFPPFYAVDGHRWYHPSPPNRWVGSVTETDPDGGPDPIWYQVDYGTPRPLSEAVLYFLDDVTGPSVEAVGDEGASGFPQAVAKAELKAGPPDTYALEYWDGERWVEVPGQVRSPRRPSGRRSNTISFPELQTEKLRVLMTPRSGTVPGLTEIETWGPDFDSSRSGPIQIPNLALNLDREGFPRVSASYTYPGDSPWETVDGRIAFTRYSRSRWTAFETPNSEDWLEVDFGAKREPTALEMFLYGDGEGVAAPAEVRVEVWDGKSWQPPRILESAPAVPLAWGRFVVRMVPIETSRVRVIFRHDPPAASGITELRIWEKS
jgi:hypothetical protein